MVREETLTKGEHELPPKTGNRDLERSEPISKDSSRPCLEGFADMVFFPLWVITRAILFLYFRLTLRHHPEAPRRGARIYCPNHVSYLDPIVVQMLTPRRAAYLMTTMYFYRPWGNWFFRFMGCIPVPERDPYRRARAMRVAIRMLRGGRSLVVFPEGRVSTDGRLRGAEAGIGVIARLSGAPVVPVAIHGTFEAWPKGGRWIKPRRVRVFEGAPMRFENIAKDVPRECQSERFTQRLMDAISAMQRELMLDDGPIWAQETSEAVPTSVEDEEAPPP